MTAAILASLLGLALLDSTSIGTLIVPLWLVLAPGRPPLRRLIAYLSVIAAFYLCVGVVLYAAARIGLTFAADVIDTPIVRVVQLIIGITLFWYSFRLDSSKNKKSGTPDRVSQIRERVLTADGSTRTVAGLALVAGATELITMLPFLGAIGLLVSSGVGSLAAVGLLVGYCAVMVVPALALVALRMLTGTRLDRPLQSLDGFLSRHADSALGWIVGIGGFYIASSAANALFFA